MTASMTAFARMDSQHQNTQLIWEIRSVNHRYLDTHLKLPDELRAMETQCRSLISDQLNRGRIDAQLKLETNARETNLNSVNQNMVESLGKMIEQINTTIPTLDAPKATDILRWPGVIVEPKTDNDELQQSALTLLKSVVGLLVENRNREGNKLHQMIQKRITTCRELVTTLTNDIDDITQTQKLKWQNRIEELCNEPDNNRLHQEIAIILTKSDISEELDRLITHFDEVEHTLTPNKPAGRRLDFLMQELNREANTLGSKSIDQRITHISVELKVLIDQMREQVQNIE